MMRIPLTTLTSSLILASLVCLLPALTLAETAVQTWEQRYNDGPGNGDDYAIAMVVDGSNNVVVTGYSYAGGEHTSHYLTMKYSSAGVPLWTNRSYNGLNSDQARAVTVDGSNNVIVTGRSGMGISSSAAYATIKYSSTGVPLWTNRYYQGGNRNTANAVAVDSSNNIIVTGCSEVSVNVGDYATIKYASTGVLLWTNRYDGPAKADDGASAIVVDDNDDVVVTGYSSGGISGYDYTTIKYSSAGVPLWTNRYDGLGNNWDQAYALAVDSSNSVIVTGYSASSQLSGDYTTIKYSSAGVPLWTNRYNGPGNDWDQANGVVADGAGCVIVTGYSYGSGSASDYATIKYSSTGEPLWTNRYNGPGNSHDFARTVVVDGGNNVIVAGSSTGTNGYEDYATIKYSSAGAPLWTNHFDGPGNQSDVATSVAVNGSNHLFVTGYSTGSDNSSDFATVKYICVPPPVMTDLQSINGTFQMRVDDVLRPGILVIESSTDLAGWLPVFTNTTPTNMLFYTDPDASNHLWRFYRAFQFP